MHASQSAMTDSMAPTSSSQANSERKITREGPSYPSFPVLDIVFQSISSLLLADEEAAGAWTEEEGNGPRRRFNAAEIFSKADA